MISASYFLFLNGLYSSFFGGKDMTHEPPKCSDCGVKLFRVFETVYATYRWDHKKGTYKEDGVLEMKCPECGADLYDVFPDGVCNFKSCK